MTKKRSTHLKEKVVNLEESSNSLFKRKADLEDEILIIDIALNNNLAEYNKIVKELFKNREEK